MHRLGPLLVKVTLVLGPVAFAFWLVERGTVPWGVMTLVVTIVAVVFGAWLATEGLNDVRREYLIEVERERLAREEATREFERQVTRLAKRQAKKRRHLRQPSRSGGKPSAGDGVYDVVVDVRSRPDDPCGDAVESYIRREDAERFIDEVRGDDPELAEYLRIEERELEVGEAN